MTLHAVPDPGPDQVTITLPDPAISRPRRVPAGFVPPPPSNCPKCRESIEVADRIRKVHGSWMHVECAVGAIARMSVSDRWLLLAEHLAATPSAFKAREIRTIVRAVIEIADSGYDEHDLPSGAAAQECEGPVPGHGCDQCRSDEELHPERFQ